MTSHRSDINKRIDNPHSRSKSKVAAHFSENGHSLDDLRIAAIKRVNDIDQRLAEEQRIIQKLGAYRAEGLNVDYYHLRNSR